MIFFVKKNNEYVQQSSGHLLDLIKCIIMQKGCTINAIPINMTNKIAHYTHFEN